MAAPVRVRNPLGLVSWVSAEQAERLLRIPGWELVQDEPTKPAKKPARKSRRKGG